MATRRRGWAEEEDEVTPGLASVAAAVLDAAGHPVAAVAVTFPADEVPPGSRAGAAEVVVGTAEVVSRLVGGRGAPLGATQCGSVPVTTGRSGSLDHAE